MRRFARSILTPEFAVLEATNGREGLRKTREHLPDVILVDVMMPSVGGREMTRRLKGTPETEAIPVIMVTARASASDEIEGLREGADDYVTKPFDADVLRQRVGAFCASSSACAVAWKRSSRKRSSGTSRRRRRSTAIRPRRRPRAGLRSNGRPAPRSGPASPTRTSAWTRWPRSWP